MAATPVGKHGAAGMPMVALQAPCCAIGSEATPHGMSLFARFLSAAGLVQRHDQETAWRNIHSRGFKVAKALL